MDPSREPTMASLTIPIAVVQQLAIVEQIRTNFPSKRGRSAPCLRACSVANLLETMP
jgi:hypothetical protein